MYSAVYMTVQCTGWGYAVHWAETQSVNRCLWWWQQQPESLASSPPLWSSSAASNASDNFLFHRMLCQMVIILCIETVNTSWIYEYFFNDNDIMYLIRNNLIKKYIPYRGSKKGGLKFRAHFRLQKAKDINHYTSMIGIEFLVTTDFQNFFLTICVDWHLVGLQAWKFFPSSTFWSF